MFDGDICYSDFAPPCGVLSSGLGSAATLSAATLRARAGAAGGAETAAAASVAGLGAAAVGAETAAAASVGGFDAAAETTKMNAVIAGLSRPLYLISTSRATASIFLLPAFISSVSRVNATSMIIRAIVNALAVASPTFCSASSSQKPASSYRSEEHTSE